MTRTTLLAALGGFILAALGSLAWHQHARFLRGNDRATVELRTLMIGQQHQEVHDAEQRQRDAEHTLHVRNTLELTKRLDEHAAQLAELRRDVEKLGR